MRRIVTAVLTATALLFGAVAISPAASADEWLYVLSSKDVRVIPGKADAGRVVLRGDTTAVQFTDRPDRRSSGTSTRTVLRDFGWTPATGNLAGKVPNAAVVIDGELTQTFRIDRAKVSKDKLVLYVRGLDGKLTADSGAGAVFIDDASGTQSTSLSPNVVADADYNPNGPSISIQLSDGGVVLWSGTLTPQSPSVTVPNSSSGNTSISGTLEALFAPTNTQVAFSGSITDNGSPMSATDIRIGQWTQN